MDASSLLSPGLLAGFALPLLLLVLGLAVVWHLRRRAAARRQAAAQARLEMLAAEQAAAEQEAAALRRAEAEAAELEALEREAAARIAADKAAADAAIAARVALEREQAERAAALERAREQAQREAQRAAREAEERAAAERSRLAAEARARAEAQAQAQAQAQAEARARAEADAREARAREAAAREAAAARPAVRVPAGHGAAPAAGMAPLVLVADDSKVVRVKTSRLLAAHGYRVALAEDGEQAARLLEAELPLVLVTDVEMPGMDGFALTRHVRSHPRARHIPIVMITSADERLQAAAAEAGVTRVLGKPYAEAELLRCIEQAQALQPA